MRREVDEVLLDSLMKGAAWNLTKFIQDKHTNDLATALGRLHATGQAGDDWLEGSSAEKDLGVWVGSKWDRRKQCALGSRKDNYSLGCISKITASRKRELILHLHSGTASGLLHPVWGSPARKRPS